MFPQWLWSTTSRCIQNDLLSPSCLQVLLTSCLPHVNWVTWRSCLSPLDPQSGWQSRGGVKSYVVAKGQPLPPVCPPHVFPMRLWCFMDLENLYWLETAFILKRKSDAGRSTRFCWESALFQNKIPSTGCRWYFTCGLWTWKSVSDVEKQNHLRAINLPNLRWERSCVNGLTSHHGVCVWRCQLFHQRVCELACVSLKGPMLCPLRLRLSTIKASCIHLFHITHSSFNSLVCLLAQKHSISIYFIYNKYEIYCICMCVCVSPVISK